MGHVHPSFAQVQRLLAAGRWLGLKKALRDLDRFDVVIFYVIGCMQ